MAENVGIQEKFKLYLELQKEIVVFRKKQAEQKKTLQNLERDIQEYMVNNDMSTISLKDGEIMLYDKKKSQTFNKSTMAERLSEVLKVDEEKAEKIVDSIVSNKVFTVEQKLKVNMKKK